MLLSVVTPQAYPVDETTQHLMYWILGTRVGIKKASYNGS